MLLSRFLHAQERDSVFLRNGQIMIGKLNKIDLGVIEFDDLDLSLQNVRYHKIKTLRATSRTLKIETIDKVIYYGVVRPSSNFGKVILQEGDFEKEYDINEIYSLTSLEKTFIKKIKGTVGGGYNFTKSSNIARTNFDWDLNIDQEKIHIDFIGTFIFTNNEGLTTRDRENVYLAGFYNLNPVLLTGLYLNYQRNIELGLASRFQQGFGFGRRIIMKSNFRSVIGSGLVINQETDLIGSSSGNLYELPISLSLN
jgi:hypothetical protein